MACEMSSQEATPCVRGSLFAREVEGVRKLIGSGRLSRAELEAALCADELDLVDSGSRDTWCSIATTDKLIALMASKSELRLSDFCRLRGAEAAEALLESGLYQQLEYLNRTEAAGISDPESRARSFGRDLRLIVSLSKQMFNFTHWTTREDPGSPRRFQIEISQASDFSDIQVDCTDGFVNWAATRRKEVRLWEWSRPAPDLVLFRMLRDA